MKSPQEYPSRSHLSVIGEDATKAFDALEWGEAEDETNIEHVLAKFDAYCEPRTQVIYERYRFNNRKQEPGENIAACLTELRTNARICQLEEITPEEILLDRIVLGIRDDKTASTQWFNIAKSGRSHQTSRTNWAPREARGASANVNVLKKQPVVNAIAWGKQHAIIVACFLR